MTQRIKPVPIDIPHREVSRIIDPEKMELRMKALDLWMDDPKHSYKKVAQDIGVSEETVRRWGREDKWKQVYTSSAFALPRDYIKSRAEEVLDDALTRLHSIVQNGEDAAANVAIRTLLSILTDTKGDVNVTVNDNSRTLMMGGEIKSVEDINRYLSLRAESNIIDVESRQKK